MKKTDRILSRILAKELKPEELGLVSSPDKGVVAAAGGPSTLVATFPDLHEDQ
ncbi:MAG TPA: hypothetical protein VGP73_00645 [Thermoanaerobaculia bacterium]